MMDPTEADTKLACSKGGGGGGGAGAISTNNVNEHK